MPHESARYSALLGLIPGLMPEMCIFLGISPALLLGDCCMYFDLKHAWQSVALRQRCDVRLNSGNVSDTLLH
ncbi:Uncharacterised protein [Chlamydia trachomatis]|nr:Uncharacterised protein [Chlamydia trachomatis]